MPLFEEIARRTLLRLDGERAHALGIKALKRGAVGASKRRDKPSLACVVAGMSFPNPLGVAAGFDKNGEVPDVLLQRGMGFAEVGTVTPLAQDGNPRPRLFRLASEKAIINRLGFNNQGHDAVYRRLRARKHKNRIVGVNIGANKNADDFVCDYAKGIHQFASVASYFAANISSPNTPGLRALQSGDSFRHLLLTLCKERDAAARKTGRKVPIFVKVAPDLTDENIAEIAREATISGISGLIVSNTTVSRTKIKTHKYAGEVGGLSGAPLFEPSTLVLAKLRHAVGPNFPLIGVGGIMDGVSALQKIRAGASLLQVYTGLVFRGFDLIDEVKDVLEAAILHERADSIADLVGLDTQRILQKL